MINFKSLILLGLCLSVSISGKLELIKRIILPFKTLKTLIAKSCA